MPPSTKVSSMKRTLSVQPASSTAIRLASAGRMYLFRKMISQVFASI